MLLYTKIRYRHHRETEECVYRFEEEIKLFPTEKGEIDFKHLFQGR